MFVLTHKQNVMCTRTLTISNRQTERETERERQTDGHTHTHTHTLTRICRSARCLSRTDNWMMKRQMSFELKLHQWCLEDSNSWLEVKIILKVNSYINWFTYRLFTPTETPTNPVSCRTGQNGCFTTGETSLTWLLQVPLEYAPVWRKTKWRFGLKRFQLYSGVICGWMIRGGASAFMAVGRPLRTKPARLVSSQVLIPVWLSVSLLLSLCCPRLIYILSLIHIWRCRRWP